MKYVVSFVLGATMATWFWQKLVMKQAQAPQLINDTEPVIPGFTKDFSSSDDGLRVTRYSRN